ncbi:hypothetical protein GQ602_006695 [Ophiocordyceps camponoti-floridani]|uniref:Uncharacterized protein n=1 Tax=Ophiocordyceps camponoti-floridani TaxID=2030778 RepID=A0A8H4Q1V9_9HYPO|nr:hypothetical protein GQ602_006695 [Ophiocordyceps camponoti-floridani]
MPPKQASQWEQPAFLNSLVCALYEVANLTPEAKKSVEEFLRREGHSTSWDGIRYKLRRNRDAGGKATTATPTKATAGTKKKAAPKKNKKEVSPADDADDDDDDDDDDEVKNLKREPEDAEGDELVVKTPVKKRVKKEVKKESSSGEDNIDEI